MMFLENCRMNGKKEIIMLQMAGLMGSILNEPKHWVLSGPWGMVFRRWQGVLGLFMEI